MSRRDSCIFTGMITCLQPNQILVFGSNASGFHGAGAAGFACRGTSQNTWRHDEWFLKAMKSPVGSTERVGKWAIFGHARGLQQGREGRSYAIVTIKHPGQRRSIPLSEIQAQFVDLCSCCHSNPQSEFLFTAVGSGLAGYTAAEMLATFRAALKQSGGKPANLVLPQDLYSA